MSKTKKLSLGDWILYIILKGLQKTIEVFPRRPALFGGKLLGRTVFHLMPSRRKITIDNLARAFPENSDLWAYETALKVFENFGRNIVELIKYASGRYFDFVRTEGMDKIEGGGILLMGHYGHWEITGMALPDAGIELYPIGRRIHSLAFDKLVDDMRTVFGSHHIPYRNSIRQILRKLKDEKNICVLVDQHMRSGIPVEFFGRPVRVTQLVPLLYRRTGVRVTPAYSWHEGDEIIVKYDDPIDFVDSDDPLKAELINTQKQMAWLEGVIREKPDEWFWMHNLWKSHWRAVFVDRDGTINQDHGYVSRIQDFDLISGALEALRMLRKENFLIVVITNQSGIARGYYTERDYFKLNSAMLNLFESEGAFVDRVYHCPHHPGDKCVCRKPSPALGLLAAKELNINLSESYMIGDKASDIEFAANLGVRSVLVETGEGKKSLPLSNPDIKAQDILHAARLIIDENKK
ncbi:MAG: D-glycero-beta-D-manno-heptose 1,7-bisphosphate 7-phosphatase [Elusimicrobia bacterium]|nr:D-glycero-beta-D-manno-heptose 1,7-bisphosphate 7-phosphatase [Elusimicrobiota bacterium]